MCEALAATAAATYSSNRGREICNEKVLKLVHFQCLQKAYKAPHTHNRRLQCGGHFTCHIKRHAHIAHMDRDRDGDEHMKWE